MSLYPYRGPQAGFKGHGVHRDLQVRNFQVTARHVLPAISSVTLPPGDLPGQGGAIAYDIDTKRPYYSDGTTWIPISGATPTGTTLSYGFIKSGNLVVPTATETTITNWSIASSAVYHTLPEWDLTTGIYTSAQDEYLSLEVNTSWLAGVSNLGDRTLRVQYRLGGVGAWDTVKEVSTQADPDVNVATTQECQIHTELAAGDQIRVVVEHDAPVSLTISGGVESSISGFQIEI